MPERLPPYWGAKRRTSSDSMMKTSKKLALILNGVIDGKAGGVVMATINEPQVFLFLSQVLG